MKTTFFTKFICLCTAILMVTAVLPHVSTEAHAQSKMSAPVTGQNLLVAHFPGGRFENTGQGIWTEYDRNGINRYTFRELRRDRDTVYLREDALQVDLELNAARRIIMASWPGRARHQLHRIDRVDPIGGIIGAPPRPIPPIAPPAVTPPVPVPVTVIVSPNTVAKVIYTGGRFEEAGANTGIWTQYSNAGGVSTYAEIGHDQTNLYLFDKTRDVLVVIDVRNKIIRESRNGGLLKKQHVGVNMFPMAAPEPQRPAFTLTQAQRQQCLASGGRVERAGMLGAERCTLSYGDAGKICTDSSQCQGKCVADLDGANQINTSGTCQKTDNPFGCYAFVENGQTGPALCAD